MFTSVSELRKSLANPHQVQYIDRESGQLITTSSSSARRALKKELEIAVLELHEVNIKLEATTDSVTQLDIAVLNKESVNEAKAELGPLVFISELTGYPMNKIINWLLLLVIFVFDPLAIALVVAANFAFSQTYKKKENVTEEYPQDDLTFECSVPEGKEFNTPYPLSDIMKEPTIEETQNIYGDTEIKVDLDGDGKADIILKDTDGDGKVDKIVQVPEHKKQHDGRTGGVRPLPK